MKLHLLTIVLDGLPWLTHHIAQFNRLQCDWTWHVIEGAAMPNHDTSWCKFQAPRLSKDGTTQYLDGLASHPRVRLYRRPAWDGKREMVNEPLLGINERCVLVEADADEIWTAEHIEAIVAQFAANPDLGVMRFRCNYFVGPNIVSTKDGTYGNRGDEWTRAWRYEPGMRFLSHEPPNLAGNRGAVMDRHETAALGLYFNHYAYVTEAQIAFKQAYYGYRNAVDQWRRLQANSSWPVRLIDYLPWVDAEAVGDLFVK